MDHFDLKKILEEHGISQKKLAQLINVTEWTVSRWCQGKTSIKPKYINMIKMALKTSSNLDVMVEREYRFDPITYQEIKQVASSLGLTPEEFLHKLLARFVNLYLAELYKEHEPAVKLYGLPEDLPPDEDLHAAEQ